MTTSDTSVWNIIKLRPEEAEGNTALDRYLFDEERVLPFEGPGFRVREADNITVPITELLRARNALRLEEAPRSVLDARAQSNLMLDSSQASIDIYGIEVPIDLPSTRAIPTTAEGLQLGTPQSQHNQRERMKVTRRMR
jgi:hypothetical protein